MHLNSTFYESLALADFAAALAAYAVQGSALECVASLMLHVVELSNEQMLSEEQRDEQ